MPNKNTDMVYQLVRSMSKAEKRNFKLYIKRNGSDSQMKIVVLFDALNKMDSYDEAVLLAKNPSIQKQQLSNIKAHLYRELLASLRLISLEQNIDLRLHEYMDYARILYNKGLYIQSLNILEKTKELALSNHQHTYLLQALFFEKKIEALHITRSIANKATELNNCSDDTLLRLAAIDNYASVSLQLYSWYIKEGMARNEEDEAAIQLYFDRLMPPRTSEDGGFYERMYLYQCYCWYAFIRQDFLMYYRYAQKWVGLFSEFHFMLQVETAHYIKGMHNLLSAHFSLSNYQKFNTVLEQFEYFSRTDLVINNDNNTIQSFIYISLARLNKYFSEGRFEEGQYVIPEMETGLKAYDLHIDEHRLFVFYYKFACLYFGAGNYDKAIDYLNKIINKRTILRTDLHCYARLLHLIAHYELENYDLVEYLIRSVYRFIAKMNHQSLVEEAVFKFLRKTPQLSTKKMTVAFGDLLSQLKHLEQNRYERRAFAYLDIISWLESKIENVPVQTVIRKKYENKLALYHKA